MTTRLCLTLAMTALVGATVSGQTPAQAVDAIFKEFDSDHVPGCAVGATRGDVPIFAKAYGMADLEHGVPLTPQSAFYMASVSKQFAALAILLLEQDGKLRLEDGVRTYVPELPAHADAITIRQLLHHTSGLRDYLTTLADGSAIANGYGIGLSAGTHRGVRAVSHGGSLAGYRTSSLRLPGEKLTVVVLCNTSTANSRSAHLVAEVHATTPLSAAPSAPAAPPQPPADSVVPRELAEALAGVYWSEELDATSRLVAGADGVTLQVGNSTPFALRLSGPDLLRGPR
jgi:CubicO group peptidase (beta-lactamase class C family)